jgi:chemotaxis receptor (MCP) glutamine deamidase CheD
MISSLGTLPGTPEHCSGVQHLRVRRELAGGVRTQVSRTEKVLSPHKNRICLYIGEVAASKSAAVIDTLLGSCVSVCLYDPILRIGGMNHILLPNCRAGETTPRCGVHAMELLINELMKLGGDRRRFVAKAFGGANVLEGMRMPPIGEGNAKFVRGFLALEKIPLVAERLGGNHAVHLYFRTDTGRATVHTVDGSSLPNILDAEGSYSKSPLWDKPFSGEITLF